MLNAFTISLDSKTKSATDRELFFNTIMRPENIDKFGWKTAIIHPERISNSMLQKLFKLN